MLFMTRARTNTWTTCQNCGGEYAVEDSDAVCDEEFCTINCENEFDEYEEDTSPEADD
jgi:hypothetical protein